MAGHDDQQQHAHAAPPPPPPFHLAVPTHSVAAAREFYGSMLGCPEGRRAERWCDFNLFGHQLVAHQVDGYHASASANAVDGDPVPVPHFGAALSVDQFHELAARLQQRGVEFVIAPHLRFVGQPGEQVRRGTAGVRRRALARAVWTAWACVQKLTSCWCLLLPLLLCTRTCWLPCCCAR
jgi:extradiol dioxygenase family protein